jgi:hypothetical protein
MKDNVAQYSRRVFVMILAFSMIPWMIAAGEVGYRAVVLDVKGKAFVLHAGVKKAIDLGCVLYSGDSVETTKDALVTVNYLESGREEHWIGEAKFVVEKDGSHPAPAQMKMTERIVLPDIESPLQAGATTMKNLLGDAEMQEEVDLEVAGLSNTRTIEEKPEFRWSPIRKAQKYRVKLYRFPENELRWLLGEHELIWQRTAINGPLSFPLDVPPLSPGGRYRWVVEALDDGSVVAKKWSCFSLPSSQELMEIKKGVNSYRTQLEADSSNTATRLRFAFFLEERALFDDALEQYGVLQKQLGESGSLKDRRVKIVNLRSSDCRTY